MVSLATMTALHGLSVVASLHHGRYLPDQSIDQRQTPCLNSQQGKVYSSSATTIVTLSSEESDRLCNSI